MRNITNMQNLAAFVFLVFTFGCDGGGTGFPKVEMEKQHDIRFVGAKKSSFLKALVDRTNDYQFYYAILGHPHEDRANKLHLKSYMTLHQTMSAMQFAVKAVSLNNDYPEPKERHTYESKLYEKQSFVDNPPGHGIDSKRPEFSYFGSQDWVMDYGEKKLGIQYEKANQHTTMDFDFLGIMAHSWFDCIHSLRIDWMECIHIIQLRNYDQFYPKDMSVFELAPIFHWINADLERNQGNPTLIVFQEFNSEIEPIMKKLAEKITNPKEIPKENYNILAVLFTIMDEKIEITEKFCPTNRTPVPVISFGGLPQESYIMLQFGSDKPGIRHLYQLNVSANNKTIANEIDLSDWNCISAEAAHDPTEL